MNELAIRAIAAVALVGALFGAHLAYSSHYVAIGEARANATNKAQRLADDKKSAEDLAAANKRGKTAEDALKLFRSETDIASNTEKVNHAKALEVERARAISGRSGLHCPAATVNQNDPARTAANSTPSGAPGDSKGTDLVPGAADAVLRIASDSAELVRDYNELLAIRNKEVATVCSVK